MARVLIIVSMLLAAQGAIPGICRSAPPPPSCNFSTPLGSAVLAFGTLDPANPVNVAATPTAIQFTCTKTGGGAVAFQITETRSASYNVPPAGYKMQHVGAPASEYLPYSIRFVLNGVPIVFPYTGSAPKNALQTITINGTVLGTSYENAYFGSYSDLVSFAITP